MQHMSQALVSDSAQPEQQQDKTLQQYSEYLLQHFVQRVSWLEVVPAHTYTHTSVPPKTINSFNNLIILVNA